MRQFCLPSRKPALPLRSRNFSRYGSCRTLANRMNLLMPSGFRQDILLRWCAQFHSKPRGAPGLSKHCTRIGKKPAPRLKQQEMSLGGWNWIERTEVMTACILRAFRRKRHRK